ncbi:putative transporter protein [Diplonema papillatum]|nr:putative transporter protein [Diplonema papillatum]
MRPRKDLADAGPLDKETAPAAVEARAAGLTAAACSEGEGAPDEQCFDGESAVETVADGKGTGGASSSRSEAALPGGLREKGVQPGFALAEPMQRGEAPCNESESSRPQQGEAVGASNGEIPPTDVQQQHTDAEVATPGFESTGGGADTPKTGPQELPDAEVVAAVLESTSGKADALKTGKKLPDSDAEFATTVLESTSGTAEEEDALKGGGGAIQLSEPEAKPAAFQPLLSAYKQQQELPDSDAEFATTLLESTSGKAEEADALKAGGGTIRLSEQAAEAKPAAFQVLLSAYKQQLELPDSDAEFETKLLESTSGKAEEGDAFKGTIRLSEPEAKPAAFQLLLAAYKQQQEQQLRQEQQQAAFFRALSEARPQAPGPARSYPFPRYSTPAAGGYGPPAAGGYAPLAASGYGGPASPFAFPGSPYPPDTAAQPLVQPPAPAGSPSRVFALLFLATVATFFDIGAVAVLVADPSARMQCSVGMRGVDEGLTVFHSLIGLALGIFLFGTLFQSLPASLVAKTGVLLAATAVGALSFSVERRELQVKRVLSGVANGFVVVFTPLWVQVHAPGGKKVLWASLASLAGYLGTLSGLVVTGFVMVNSPLLTWRWVFAAPAVVLVLVFAGLLRVPAADLDLRGEAVKSAFGAQTLAPVVGLALSGNYVFCGAALSLCSAACVAGGALAWVMKYVATEGVPAPVHGGNAAVGLAAGTLASAVPLGLAAGACLGGVFSEEAEGEQPPARRQVRAAGVGFAFAVVAAGAGFGAGRVDRFGLFCACFWALFFGCSAVAPCAAFCLSSAVPAAARSLAEVVSKALNCTGFAVGALSVSFATRWFSRTGTVTAGFQAILCWSASIAFFQVLTLFAAAVQSGPPALGDEPPPPPPPLPSPLPFSYARPVSTLSYPLTGPARVSGSTGANTRYPGVSNEPIREAG